MKKTILLAAAGTSGHIRPAWILGQQAQARGMDVVWVGSKNDAWEPRSSWPRLNLDIRGVRRQGLARWLSLPQTFALSVWRIYRMMRKHKPSCVVLMGGYVTMPVACVAYLLRIPYIVFEQNTVMGLSNRLALPCARAAFSGLPLVHYNPSVRCIGNPLPQWCEARPQEHSDKLRILVFGGSLGALFINKQMAACFALFKENYDIIHITGTRHLAVTEQAYKEAGVSAVCYDYVDCMDELYSWADIVIARSGAMTVSELLRLQKPSILVPYVHAADNHQWHNARWLCALGAAVLVEEDQDFEKNMSNCLKKLSEPHVLEKMSQVMAESLCRFDADVFWQELGKYLGQ